ncbi:hypothetical protein [Arthrobacter sp. UYCu723]
MKAPAGLFLLIVIGAAVAVAGIVFVVLGFKAWIKKDLRLPSGSAMAPPSVMVVGEASAVVTGNRFPNLALKESVGKEAVSHPMLTDRGGGVWTIDAWRSFPKFVT